MRQTWIIFTLLVAVACTPAPNTPATTPTTVVLATTAPTQAPPTSPAATITPESDSLEAERVAAWREDLHSLASELERRHRNLYWRVTPDEFAGSVAALDDRIPELTDEQIIVEMERIVALVDGHTLLPLFQVEVNFQVYPLRFYQFPEGLYVVAAEPPHEELVGARVVQIGRLSAAEAFAAVAPLMLHDNDMAVQNFTPAYLRVPQVLRALGIIDDLAQPGFVLEQPDGTQTTLNLEPVAAASLHGLEVTQLPQVEGPLWLSRHAETNFWFTYLEDSATLFIQINSMETETQSGQNIAAFAREIKAFAAEHDVERAVIDLRHNPGGDASAATPVTIVLRSNERLNQPGHLYVLTSRQTTSGASAYAVVLERDTQALFAGEATGGRPNHYAGSTTITLPNSGIEVWVSTEYYEFSTPDDERAWLAPDLAVTLTAADYFAGRDPVLEAVLAANVR